MEQDCGNFVVDTMAFIRKICRRLSMNWNRSQLKQMGKTALSGSYWKSVLVAIIMTIALCAVGGGISGAKKYSYSAGGGSSPFVHNPGIQIPEVSGVFLVIAALLIVFSWLIVLALRIFLLGPLEVGCQRYFLEDIYQPTMLDRLKAGFTSAYWNSVKTQLLRWLYTFLWSLLLIVPGIIKSYEYRMMPFILAENPNMPSDEVFRLSKQMMDGEKWNAFVLDLSFIGWAILNCLTLGILGVFYVNPYYYLTCAALYHALKEKMQQNQYGQGNPNQFIQGNPNQFNQGNPNQFNQGNPNQFNQGNPNQFNQGNPNQFNQGNPNQFNQGNPTQFTQGNTNQFN